MVLTVGNNYYRTAFLALGAERLRGSVDCIFKIGPLNRNRAWSDGTQEHFGGHIIGGHRQLHERGSRKNNEAYPVALEFVDEARNREFRPFKARGGIILRQHGVGHVEANHNLGTLDLAFREFRPHLRTGEPENEKGKTQAEKHRLPPSFGTRPGRHEGTHRFRVAQRGYPAFAKGPRHSVKRRNERHQQQKQQKIGMKEIEHYGKRRKNNLIIISRSRAIRARTAYSVYNSL